MINDEKGFWIRKKDDLKIKIFVTTSIYTLIDEFEKWKECQLKSGASLIIYDTKFSECDKDFSLVLFYKFIL